MVVQMEPARLIKLFDDFVGNVPVMFNFRTNGTKLWVQMLGDYTACTEMDVTSIDGDFREIDASFKVTKFVHVMNKDEYVRITITDAAVFLNQNTFYCTLLKEYEERREFPSIEGLELQHAFPGRLKYLAHAGVSCMPMAKELSIPNPDPVFANSKYYLNYRQAAYIDSMKYPEMCLPFSTMRDFVFKLAEKTDFLYLQESNILYYKSGEYEFWVPTTNYNISNATITTFDKKVAECKAVTTVCFKEFSQKLQTVAMAFPKQLLTLAIADKKYNISADTNISHMQVGYEIEQSLFTMDITSAQLVVITKLFGDEESVIVKRGVGCICLTSGEKNLLIAGRSY